MNTSLLLQQADIRSTPGRVAVYEAVAQSAYPVSIEDVRNNKQIQSLNLDKVSVYRITKLFIEKGILRQVDFHEGKFRYEVGSSHHHHIICSQCGSIKDIDDCLPVDIHTAIEKQSGYIISSHSLEFFGLCRKCQTLPKNS